MIDYKEFKSKKGETIIFCKFEELLKDFYGVSSMKEVEPHAVNGEYIIHCPFCKEEGHTKHKLYIREDLTTGFCHVCNRTYINLTDDLNISYKLPNVFNNFGMIRSGVVLPTLLDPKWSLDTFEYDFDDFSQVGYNYLLGRHPFMADLYKILGFKFMGDNIAMPFKYHGKIAYYQIRFSGNSKIRYFFPPCDHKMPYIIERESNKKFIIVEGVFDAIACLIMAPEYTPVAILGHSINDYQLDFIREYVPEEIIVYQDETKLSKDVAAVIAKTIDYCPIHIIKSTGEDPEECMKRRMANNQSLQWIKSEIFKNTIGNVKPIC